MDRFKGIKDVAEYRREVGSATLREIRDHVYTLAKDLKRLEKLPERTQPQEYAYGKILERKNWAYSMLKKKKRIEEGLTDPTSEENIKKELGINQLTPEIISIWRICEEAHGIYLDETTVFGSIGKKDRFNAEE